MDYNSKDLAEAQYLRFTNKLSKLERRLKKKVKKTILIKKYVTATSFIKKIQGFLYVQFRSSIPFLLLGSAFSAAPVFIVKWIKPQPYVDYGLLELLPHLYGAGVILRIGAIIYFFSSIFFFKKTLQSILFENNSDIEKIQDEITFIKTKKHIAE
ncbi:hypothetical protein [Enterococcus sp. AZ007]|uniref:hypothetical protein n=1 Tax=Enterococcus sp. AZ007 TaxID=2774839 RepID=UPI003F26AB4A